MRQIDPLQLEGNVFSRIGTQWMLITARDGQKVNTMTASWGGLGEMWGLHTAMAVIRPQRYTYGFVEAANRFTLSFLPKAYREAYTLLGSKSGRDGDKIAEAGLTLQDADGLPSFREAELVLCCNVLYKQDMREDCFVSRDILARFYPEHDLHRLYVANILSAWTL